MTKLYLSRPIILLLLLLFPFSIAAFAVEEVNIYTLRQPSLLSPVLDKFTKQTGIKVNATWIQNGILARLEAEGKHGVADAVISVDVSRLDEIAKAGLFTNISSALVNEKIPVQFRDRDNRWVGLTHRVRVIIASKDRVSLAEAPTSYEQLADPKWKGRICTRSGKHVYNIGVIASMVAMHGQNETKIWLQGLKNNLVRRPSGNDRSQAKAIYEGSCDIALINSYYLGIMATNEKDPVQKQWYHSVNVLFPNQQDRGAHVNISGIGILKNGKNAQNALKLVAYMMSDEAQQDYARLNFEYPIVSGINPSPIVASWGSFISDRFPLQNLSDYTGIASKLVDDVRYDF